MLDLRRIDGAAVFLLEKAVAVDVVHMAVGVQNHFDLQTALDQRLVQVADAFFVVAAVDQDRFAGAEVIDADVGKTAQIIGILSAGYKLKHREGSFQTNANEKPQTTGHRLR